LTPTFSPRTEVRLPEVHLRKDRPNGDRPREPRSGGKLGSSDFNLTPPVVLMKGAKDPTFVISFRSQKEIVSATAWKAVAMVCAGTVITLFGLCLLWTQMALL